MTERAATLGRVLVLGALALWFTNSDDFRGFCDRGEGERTEEEQG